MNKAVAKALDVLDLSYEIERDSQSGALSQILLQKGHTLYAPYPTVSKGLRRISPSGNIELGYWQDGEFVVTEVNPERESDK